MKWVRIATASLIVLLLLACRFLTSYIQDRGVKTQEPGSQIQNTGSQEGSPGDFSYIFEIPTDPIQIAVTPDASSAVETVVPVDGGTLTATGADGTVYQLAIPPNALEFDTRITLTPLTAVNGLPFGGGQTFAVQIAPEGLFLDETAVLTITPPQPIPVQQQILFGYRGDGENLILALPGAAAISRTRSQYKR